tara:strand:+ start:2748 stop:3353 length:606 start_codon:yes stop_codon:yes gene_type:complete
MANIRDFVSGIFWKIDTTSQAGRVTQYNTDASLVKTIDGVSKTYSASITGLVVAATATDFLMITGSATKTIRVTKIEIIGTASTAAATDITIIKRSGLDEAGTSTTLTNVPNDSSDAAATAVIKAYTANPSALGASVGNILSSKLFLSTAATQPYLWKVLFGDRASKSIVLRGASECLCLNYNSATNAGNSISISVEFIED